MPATKRSGLRASGVRVSRSVSSPSITSRRKVQTLDSDDARSAESDENFDDERASKRRKTLAPGRASGSANLFKSLFAKDANVSRTQACNPPSRQHTASYHRPIFLDKEYGRENRKLLLSWFDSVSSLRSMPWRKPWVDPTTKPDPAELRKTLERRAYEVWISEIMLQQTRVAVVIEYWNSWMAKWPTIHDLAAADSDDVLAAWRGLGYYSRAARIHEGAKLVVSDSQKQGLLPASAADLQAQIPGVGPYTAGAISAIVFGRPEAMVDGNVLRVLSRQLGIRGNIKGDKAVIDTIWAAADALAKAVARDGEVSEDDSIVEDDVSDRPGRWGQALMELGSTICTPKPNCSECPVTSTCRVYDEGLALAKKRNESPIADIEDLCSLCEPLEENWEEEVENGDESSQKKAQTAKKSKPKSATLESFGFTGPAKEPPPVSKQSSKSTTNTDRIVKYAQKFPLKVIKKAVREEHTLVCAITRDDGAYLIHRRPEKGLLAGMWELPSQIVSAPNETTPKSRREMAHSYVEGLFKDTGGTRKLKVKHVNDFGSVPWLFSHIKLTMHVHLFTVDDEASLNGDMTTEKVGQKSRWSTNVDEESMGTGMRKCFALVKGG